MRTLLVFLLLLQTAFASGVAYLNYELGVKRRGELLSQRSLERNKLLMGIDPETCRRITEPTELTALLKRQIEIIRSIGELNHCEHLVTIPLQKINSELANYPLPPYASVPDADRPTISSGRAMSKEFQEAYLPPSELKTGRQHIDPLFKNPSPTEFAGHKMSSEGMHALRVFYSSEPALKPQIAPRLKYPLQGNETFYHYPECRIIVSGGLEITSVIPSDPQDAGRNEACAEACDAKLEAWLAEKKPEAFLMTCHHLGEIVSTRSKGSPRDQGIKQINLDGTSKQLLGTCTVRVRNGERLYSGPVVYKSECYARFKDAYLGFERRLPLVAPDTTQYIIDAYLTTMDEALIASAAIKTYPLTDFKTAPDGKCHAEDILLLKNGDKTKEIRTQGGDCTTWCLSDFRAYRNTAPGVDKPLARAYSGNAQSWHYRCVGGDGNTILLCTHNRLIGCR